MFSLLGRVVQLAGAHAINGILEGVVVALFAFIFLWAISCRNSRTRFAVLFSTLLAIAGLSFVGVSPMQPIEASAIAPHLVLPMAWAEYALIAWALIAAAGLLRIAVGLGRLWWLKRKCEVVPDSGLNPELRQTLADFRSVRRAELRISDTLRVPAAMGFFKPAVVLPRWAIEELSPAELNAVVLHELGHLSRWDDWTNLAQRIVRAALFFHPAVWWIDSRLTLEREMACDDLVLAHLGDSRKYAECLVAVAEKSAINARLALALAAVTRMKQTALRLTRILDHTRVVDTRMSRIAVSTVAAVGALALVALPHTPAFIAFRTVAPIREVQSRTTEADHRVAWRGVTPAHYADTQASPHVVPAMLRYSEPAKSQHRTLTRNRIHSSLAQQKTAKQIRSAGPAVTRVAFSTDSVPSPSLLLVVEIQEYGNAVSSSWTFCVWRVSVSPAPGPAQTKAQNGTVSKAI